jgi:hypothetical protein
MMRAYCRFAILLQLGVAMLAAYGITGFLRRRRNHGRATAAACLIAALVLFEYWPWPGPKVIDVSQVPAAYEWLAAEPKDTVIAVYPLDLEGENPFFKFYQTRHGKKMINGAIPGLPGYAQNKALEQLSSPLTQKSLKERGVRYIFVHTANYLATDLESQRREVDAILASPGLRLKETYPAQPCEKEQPRCIRDAGEIKVFELSV